MSIKSSSSAEIAKAAEKPLQKIKEVFKLTEISFKSDKNIGDKVFSPPTKRFDSSYIQLRFIFCD
jgi:hypothetical protein